MQELDVSPSHELEDSQWLRDAILDGHPIHPRLLTVAGAAQAFLGTSEKQPEHSEYYLTWFPFNPAGLCGRAPQNEARILPEPFAGS